MKLFELIKIINLVNRTKYKICLKKNKDYSVDENAHKNFEELAALCKLMKVDVSIPLGCMEFLILFKLRRLFKLKRAGTIPENESLFDTVVDIEVYQDLYLTYKGIK